MAVTRRPSFLFSTTIQAKMNSDDLTDDADDPNYEIIEDGPISTVSRTWTAYEGREPEWIVAKFSTCRRKFAKEPHDIVKELRILSKLAHENIITIYSHFKDVDASILTIYLPYIPHSLAQLLSLPAFSPFPTPASNPDPAHARRFTVLTKSISFQVLGALAYLHSLQIAHRDIKPANILLAPNGRVVLIDFGIAYEVSADGNPSDLWPEKQEHMYFEVSTGAYRAPELLFGARSYDAAAIDLWSFGTVLAEMCTALRCEEDDDEEPVASAQAGDPPFVSNTHSPPSAEWYRDTLFNGRRGEIGLAWSIFKIRGTPTDEMWPGFRYLPGSSSVEFTVVPRVPLEGFLPNLPPNSPEMLDLIQGFLAYPPSERLTASAAQAHQWFAGGVLLPDMDAGDGAGTLADFLGRLLS
ncbi:CMGC/CDK protein kinase [Mycena amicta]|nr:CMGC/CDK protein kinase [Mycena amicta]